MVKLGVDASNAIKGLRARFEAPKVVAGRAAAMPADAFTPSPGAVARYQRYAAEGNSLGLHALFFDPQGTGLVDFGKAKSGFEALGINKPVSALLAGGLVTVFGTKTSGHPSLTIHLDNLKAGKHPGDSGVLDANGRFSEAGWNNLWATYDSSPRDGNLSLSESIKMAWDRRATPISPLQSFAEFGLLIPVAHDRMLSNHGLPDPAVSNQRLLDFYQGKLFYDLAAERGNPRPFPGGTAAAPQE